MVLDIDETLVRSSFDAAFAADFEAPFTLNGGPHPEADQKPGEASAATWPMGGALGVANKSPSEYSGPFWGWACA